ncbi:unnamed protein product [Macrosiphum euphorbiae]|uniref:Uncharacterized protein n=1 Tax=Macrosiphum euphorbiae TaxID=13131 RepID=A0AAV0XC01_9HEMI|nr:unnamed protein product [Macrosiphum euphorbiae]
MKLGRLGAATPLQSAPWRVRHSIYADSGRLPHQDTIGSTIWYCRIDDTMNLCRRLMRGWTSENNESGPFCVQWYQDRIRTRALVADATAVAVRHYFRYDRLRTSRTNSARGHGVDVHYHYTFPKSGSLIIVL